MNFKTGYTFFSCILIAVILSSCGTPANDNDAISNLDTVAAVQHEKNTKVQKVFASIPSQSETTTLLKDAGAKYNAAYLSPIENLSKYVSLRSRALNLGVYGTDLSFTSIFDQTQESMLYLRCTNKLSTGLGITGAFDENMNSRLEANTDNKDSLLAIISESYFSADKYLQENGQAGVSALLIAGGWIEGLYIATKIADDTKNETIISRVVEQYPTLINLISLLESYKKDNEDSKEALANLNELKKVYDDIAAENPSVAEKLKTAGTPGNTTLAKPTAVQFKRISDKSAEIRAKTIAQ